MKLDQTFHVDATPDAVWAALTDVLRVAPCLPGAAITEESGDGMFRGEFTVKLGPTTASYNGSLKMEHLDQEGRVATMSARGTDKRGQGGATAQIVSRVQADEEAGGTRVDVETDFSITGKLARFGRGGMIQDVSNKLLREFAKNLQEDLGGTGGAAPDAPAVDAATGPIAAAPDSVPDPGSSSPGTSPDPPAGATPTPPRTPRKPAEPLDGGGLVAGVLLDRAKAGALPLLLGLVLGAILFRRRS